ncbi:MAG TPA: hypothetical protein VHM27_10950 [Rhizomicrobium sp.]|nr:hypothetical protein [Rhizomicrobium sp.]
MRDFSFDPARPSTETITGPEVVREEIVPDPVTEEIIQPEEPPVGDRLNLQERLDRDGGDGAMQTIRVEDDEETNNWPKLIGAAVVAVLVVGGGIYAYESSMTKQPAQAAMKTPAPASNMAASQPVAPPPESNPMPAPMPAPAPMKSAAQAPAPTPPVQTAAKVSTPGVGIGPTDDPNIDAPMTYTMDNVPPPQKEGSPSRVAATPSATANQTMAVQQPTPNVGNSSPPTGSVAANPSPGTAAPALRQVQPAVPPAQPAQ